MLMHNHTEDIRALGLPTLAREMQNLAADVKAGLPHDEAAGTVRDEFGKRLQEAVHQGKISRGRELRIAERTVLDYAQSLLEDSAPEALDLGELALDAPELLLRVLN